MSPWRRSGAVAERNARTFARPRISNRCQSCVSAASSVKSSNPAHPFRQFFCSARWTSQRVYEGSLRSSTRCQILWIGLRRSHSSVRPTGTCNCRLFFILLTRAPRYRSRGFVNAPRPRLQPIWLRVRSAVARFEQSAPAYSAGRHLVQRASAACPDSRHDAGQPASATICGCSRGRPCGSPPRRMWLSPFQDRLKKARPIRQAVA
ncbi:MAG: hypothetical protein JWR80_4231 [Bradyrhizobium sp.]|nr:hypothetical protein [Bradyrhizobium sp.]